MAWEKEILKGVDSLPKEGVPGRIVVFGAEAEPILTGTNEEDVLVAAAELGKGRIVCISHDAYGKKFCENDANRELQLFHENLKHWLTRGTFKDNSDIINAKEDATAEKLRSAKIVIFNGGPIKINPGDLAEFLRNGGGLFHCLTPWGWLQTNKGKTLSDAPYAGLLVEAGLCYSDEYINVMDNKFTVKDNKTKDAHLMKVLEEVEKHPQKAEKHANVLKKLVFLPKAAITQVKPTVEKIWKECKEEVSKGNVPTPKHPAGSAKDKAFLDLWLLCVNVLEITNVKAQHVDAFPGDFTTEPPLKCYVLEFHSKREDFFSSSCYLPAGETLKVEVVSGNQSKGWSVLVGCHSDHLTKDKFRRWPKVSKKVRLTGNTHEIFSAFGGSIYFQSPDKPDGNIKVKLENVTDCPQFKLVLGENGRSLWQSSRNSPGLWADIEGEHITFTLPSSSVRKLEFDCLTSTLKTWDSVVRMYHDLRGTEVSKYRRQWIVADEQPSVGYMHAGYPIVTGLDVVDPDRQSFLLDGQALVSEGRWGVFHEIGHNMQKSEWTFEGTGEVTCNVFTLFAMDSVCHLTPWIHSWLQGQVKDTEKFLKEGADHKKWKSSPGIALFLYAQLVHEFGWESYKKVFRRYEAMPAGEKPKEDHKKVDTWFLVFSEVVGYNLSPMALFWGIPLSAEASNRLKASLPVGFLPDDEVTRLAPTRVEAVLKKFPGAIRKLCTPASS